MSRTTTTIAHETQDELIAKLTTILNRLGYDVAPKRVEPITVGALAARIGRKTGSVSRSLGRKSCPQFVCVRGPSGRILKLWPEPCLMDYLQK